MCSSPTTYTGIWKIHMTQENKNINTCEPYVPENTNILSFLLLFIVFMMYFVVGGKIINLGGWIFESTQLFFFNNQDL